MIYGTPQRSLPYGANAEENFNITPSAGALVTAGVAPRWILAIVPPVGALTLSGTLPIQATASLTFTGSLTLTGLVPNKIASERPEPSTETLVLSGTLPLIINPVLRTPPTVALTTTGSASYLSRGIPPSTGSLTLTGVASRWNQGVYTGTGTVTETGYAPIGIGAQVVIPPTGNLVLDGKLPVLQRGTVAILPTLPVAVARFKFVSVWVQVYDAQAPVWTKIPT